MVQHELNFQQAAHARAADARARRDDGIHRAVTHANEVVPTWSDIAGDNLRMFLNSVSVGTRFTGEQVREFAEAHSLPCPPDKRAWGAVMLRGARAGLIVKIGWTTAKDPKVHQNPVSEWEKS